MTTNDMPPATVHVLGAEKAIRKLLWRLKRLGIDPKLVLVHGADLDAIERLMGGWRPAE